MIVHDRAEAGLLLGVVGVMRALAELMGLGKLLVKLLNLRHINFNYIIR